MCRSVSVHFETIEFYLIKLPYEVVDLGMYNNSFDDHQDFVNSLTSAVAADEVMWYCNLWQWC